MPPRLEQPPPWANRLTFLIPSFDEHGAEASRRAPSREAVWRAIRGFRHQPPGRAGKGDRRRVFCAALEQSAQLFRAAADVEYTSRPILLFYGLSQAGRAVAAASTTADNDSYRLSGHGITVQDLNQRSLHRLQVIDRAGSFTQLAPLLRSGSLPQGAPLGQVWAALPDLCDVPLDTEGVHYKPALKCRLEDPWGPEGLLTESIRLYSGKLPFLSEQETRSFLSEYHLPYDYEIRGMDGIRNPDTLERAYFVWVKLTFQKSMPSPAHIDHGDRWVFPVIGGGTLPVHPFLTWWALLYTLSMLARYESASWIRHLDVDASPNAVALETALDRALDICPVLIFDAIDTDLFWNMRT